ncbi:hypothetical protein DFH11DRAFT_1612551 [Phellopilus nigrolimitatus]|nr:hypothetical protein DFH11DRAFT_1612551 [Phellopilus nigrolimitatus]
MRKGDSVLSTGPFCGASCGCCAGEAAPPLLLAGEAARRRSMSCLLCADALATCPCDASAPSPSSVVPGVDDASPSSPSARRRMGEGDATPGWAEYERYSAKESRRLASLDAGCCCTYAGGCCGVCWAHCCCCWVSSTAPGACCAGYGCTKGEEYGRGDACMKS